MGLCNSAFVNPGFETGVFVPWVIGSGNQNLVVFLPYGGVYSAELENIGVEPGSVMQELSNPGIDCVIAFWVRTGGWTVGNEDLWEGSYQVKLHSPGGDVTIGPIDTSLTPICGEWKKMGIRWPTELIGSPITITIEALNDVINVDSFETLNLPFNVGIKFNGQFPLYPLKTITLEKEIETVWTLIRTWESNLFGRYDSGGETYPVPDKLIAGNYRLVVDGIPIATETFNTLDFWLYGNWGQNETGYTIYERTWSGRSKSAIRIQGTTTGPGSVEIKRYYESQEVWESIGFGIADENGEFTVPETGFFDLLPGRSQVGTYKVFLDGIEKETPILDNCNFTFVEHTVTHMRFTGLIEEESGCPSVSNGGFESGTVDGWQIGDWIGAEISSVEHFEGLYSLKIISWG